MAAMAAVAAIEQGYQVAMMAPTELLAEQHAINFQGWFESLGINVGWLAGKVTGKAKQLSWMLSPVVKHKWLWVPTPSFKSK